MSNDSAIALTVGEIIAGTGAELLTQRIRDDPEVRATVIEALSAAGRTGLEAKRRALSKLGVALNQVSPFRACRVWGAPLDGGAIDRASCPPEPLSRNGSVVTTPRIITAPSNGWGATCNSTPHASQRD